jgi:hypothetical protein
MVDIRGYKTNSVLFEAVSKVKMTYPRPKPLEKRIFAKKQGKYR